MTKATDNDRLMQAVRRGSKRAGDPLAADIGELFLAELQARRRRLREWLRIIHAEAEAPGGARGRAAAPRCRTARTLPCSAAAVR